MTADSLSPVAGGRAFSDSQILLSLCVVAGIWLLFVFVKWVVTQDEPIPERPS